MVDYLDEYLRAHSVSSTPIIYRRLALMTLVNGTLERRVWVRDGDRFVYPNMYTMLIGDSGSKKSTAIRDAVDFMGMCGYRNFPNPRTSTDKFLDDLADRAFAGGEIDEGIMSANVGSNAVTLAIDEATGFFCNGGSDISTAMTQIYDCPNKFTSTTRGTGTRVLEQPTITYIGGTTPPGFSKIVPPEEHQFGWLARTLIVFESVQAPYVARPKRSDAIIKTLASKIGNRLAHMGGEIQISKEGYDFLDLIGLEDIGPADTRFRSYKKRRRDHVIKLAIALVVLTDKSAIDLEIVKYANTILVYCECAMHYGLSGFGMGKNGSQLTEIITSVLNLDGKLHNRDMGAALGLASSNQKELSELITHLERSGFLSHIRNNEDVQDGYVTLRKRQPYMETFKAYIDTKLLFELEHTSGNIRKNATLNQAENRSEIAYGQANFEKGNLSSSRTTNQSTSSNNSASSTEDSSAGRESSSDSGTYDNFH